ncbi:hypothetical protein NN561_001266 [Cricetulus griseus]
MKLERWGKRKTVVALKEIQENKRLRERLRKDSRQLLEEKYRVRAENQLFMEHLRKNSEQCEKKQEVLWKKQCAQECVEIALGNGGEWAHSLGNDGPDKVKCV